MKAPARVGGVGGIAGGVLQAKVARAVQSNPASPAKRLPRGPKKAARLVRAKAPVARAQLGAKDAVDGAVPKAALRRNSPCRSRALCASRLPPGAGLIG